jgi:hypothetical protein
VPPAPACSTAIKQPAGNVAGIVAVTAPALLKTTSVPQSVAAKV